jgi:HEAT repeat protein
MKDEYRYRFTKPDCEKILRNPDSNGNDRAWALRHLDEPLQHSGTQAKQDLYVNQILAIIASKDQDPLSRLEAVRTLGRYKDPRAVKALEDAYWNAKVFPADMATAIRQQVLISLGQTANPEARELLIQVAKAGAREDTQEEKTQTLDLRLCALKGLGHFKQSDVTETLNRVMASEKDVALRNRAYLSLEESTGLRLPPDPEKWDKLLHGSPTEREAVARESSGPLILVGWWH